MYGREDFVRGACEDIPSQSVSHLEDRLTASLPEVRIGLLWHSMTSDNLGVGALTLANIALVKNAARTACVRPHFFVLGWADTNPPYAVAEKLEIVGLRLKDFVKPSGLFASARRCDLVLDIGAGDSFTDIYGLKRFGTLLASKLLVLMAGRPLVFSPQTIGPFRRAWVRRAALATMNRATAVATRDDLSTAFLREIGFCRPIVEASDVALHLPFMPTERPAGDAVRVGVNVSGLLFNGGYSRDNMFGLRASYPELTRAMLRYFLDRRCKVHLVPHVISDGIEVEDDYRINALLAKEFDGVTLAPKFHDPIAAKSYIAGMDFFVGARMHACIAAFSSGVPVLPVAYSRKFAGLFGTLGYNTLVDCLVDTPEEAMSKLDSAFRDRSTLRQSMSASLTHGLDRLQVYEALLAAQLQIAARRAG